ncbi:MULTISPECIES: hypothetical protein [Ideonella]|uniref:Thiocillin family RiPP n=1 Tax=Ideonella azotifigens TaxID=513160 RepID=A0ABN1JP32_9BURK|nr:MULTISPECIES: hypothetical protein [Ideonella]HSI50391.1 hypothetical protein [Ideonella sp.]
MSIETTVISAADVALLQEVDAFEIVDTQSVDAVAAQAVGCLSCS